MQGAGVLWVEKFLHPGIVHVKGKMVGIDLTIFEIVKPAWSEIFLIS